MPFFKIMSATPLWVFFVFAYLMVIGIKARKDRKIHIGKIFLMPGIFFTMFLAKLIQTWRIDIWLIFSATLLVNVKVQGTRTPYDGDLQYWSKRSSKKNFSVHDLAERCI